MKKILIFTIFSLFFVNQALAGSTIEKTIDPTSNCEEICAKDNGGSGEVFKGSCSANGDTVKFKSARVISNPSDQSFTCTTTPNSNQDSCKTACDNAIIAENSAIASATKNVILTSPSSGNDCSVICSKDFDELEDRFQGRCSANLDIVKFTADGVNYSAGDHSFECGKITQGNSDACATVCGAVNLALSAKEKLDEAKAAAIENNRQVDVMGNTTHNLSRNIFTRVMCNAYRIVTGSAGATFAAFAVIATGIGFFTGKVSWGLMIGVAAGIASMFGAPSIVAAISGVTTNTNCSIQINEVPVP
jgi:type IV secretory pathway VirB2 component (pilin)